MATLDKQIILDRIDYRTFYQALIPTLKENSGVGATGLCFLHHDRTPSLSVNLETGLWNCFAGCGGGDAFSFYQRLKGVDFPTALKEIAGMQGIEGTGKPSVVATFEYKSADGKTLYVKERMEPGRSGRGKEFRFKHSKGDTWVSGRGHDPVLYNLPQISGAKKIVFVEGEGKADLLMKWGLPATTLDSGADSGWRDQYTEILEGKEKVVILPDNDQPGRSYALKIANVLHGKVGEIKMVELPGLQEKGDILNWVKAKGNDKARLVELIKAHPAWEPDENEIKSFLSVKSTCKEWEEPVLFGQIETPDISASALPSWLGDYTEAVSKHTQTPSALSVMLSLSTIATCIQKRFDVSPFNDGYSEPLSVWTVSVLPPAGRKTAVISAVTEPLISWEKEKAELMQEEMAEVETSRTVSLKRIENLQIAAAKDKDSVGRNRLVKEILELKEQTPEEKRPPRLWTGDVTPERLQNLMAEYGERMALLSDEGGIFEVMAGLYSNGRANLDIFLQAHAGKSIRVDRGSRTAILHKPALTFGLAIQPDVLGDLSRGNKRLFRGNGTLARFLYAIPKSNIGYRDVTKREPIPETIKARYESGIYSLLSIPPLVDQRNNEIPRILTLNADALKSWVRFSAYVENGLKEGGELCSIQDWGGKLPGAALRIAGLMHVVEHDTNSLIISKETLERSLDLCELLIAHAKAAFDLMGDDQATIDAKHILRWILDLMGQEFRQSECHRAFHGRFRDISSATR
jgi:putative DNA primase/helicase